MIIKLNQKELEDIIKSYIQDKMTVDNKSEIILLIDREYHIPQKEISVEIMVRF
jgi:hypothetical protein